jgi:hypothetical protein
LLCSPAIFGPLRGCRLFQYCWLRSHALRAWDAAYTKPAIEDSSFRPKPVLLYVRSTMPCPAFQAAKHGLGHEHPCLYVCAKHRSTFPTG